MIVDGYISGAEVCIDEDESWTCDASENSTTSDNEGKFTIRYANGNLVSIGGTDLDSQTLLDNLLITHKLTGHSNFKAVTPVTSVAAFMEDSSLVNAVLGIDSSIDVFTFDPVANKGDGGIYDYLYEKGNQLTVLAFALQNITNNLNTTTETTQDYFKAITEEIEKEYTETETKVDIETETFITNVIENVIETKSVTIDETAKANTTKALAGILPVIEVKSSDDLTTAVIRFAVSTLQTDIQAIANGTATAETVTSYTEDLLTYIAEDQNVDSGQIAPDINAIADSASTNEDTAVEINVLLNDSYLTSSPISVTAGNGSNGTISVASNIVTYTPDADYNGTDTFTYTLTQGVKTSSANVTVTIEAVNDEPSIDIASIIQVQENQTAVTTVSVSDVDEDQLTLTLGGTDADSFNLSNDNVLTFKEEPDYETKSSYVITLSLTDGTETVTKDVTIAITNVNDSFSGEVIDGYISGAEIFIDQNFNFAKDPEEYSTTTNSDGSFLINIDDTSLFECLINRPIVADVPVGAVDSTLGEITEAYQMVLPSISDSGASTVVISPFSTIFSEAIIKAKEEVKIKDELTSIEACGTEGNQIASEISKRITEVKNSIESAYGITYETILSDFIENGSSGVVSEATAQNIATYFRPIKELQDNISSSMTSALGLPITANITFEREVIDTIFTGSTLSELPLDFYSVYTTETNDLGWRREVNFRANGAKVDQDGNINAFKCLDNPASDCVSSELNIENLGNFSEDYRQTVGFYYGSGNGSQVSIGNATGVMVVDASDVKYFFESEGQDRFSCGVEEQIQLQGDSSDDVYWEYKYQTNYDESNSATNGCGDNDVDSSARRGSIEILRRDSSTQTSIGTSYVMPDMDNTTLFSSTPKKLIENFETVDPKGILEEIATFPTDYYELEAARERLSGKEELQYTYSERYSNSNFKTQYNLKIYANNHPDSVADSLTVTNYAEDGSISSSASYTGTSALETFDNFVSSKSDEMSALFYAQGNVINGEVMDGYISGADVFIDQNFNFIKDSGEVSAKTFPDGSFKLRVLDDDQYACLIKRPIVANVPVGAVDSTQGTVTKAYQMILPSITDAGTSAVVISPYTSLLSEAIIAGKDDSNLTEDLTISQGCSSEGNAVAANITNRLNALTSSIEESFGISYSLLISDFLENSSDVLTEVRAQNVAKFFPYVKNIRDQIGSELSDKYSKTITPNLSLNQNALAIIFGDSAYTNVPLEFYSLYKTNPNENGWYSVEQIRADGASLSNSGVLSRYDCLLTNSANCDTSSLTLNNIGNASRSYIRTTSVYKDNFTAAGISGDVVIEGTESRGYRDNGNGGNQFFCETQERIQFNGSADSAGINPEYRYGFGTSANDIEDCAALANYNPNLQLRVESQGNNLPNSNGTAPVMALQFPGSNLVKTKLVNSKVFKIVDNNDINPAALIDEVAEIPYKFSQLDELRTLLIDQESAYFYYTPNSANVGTEENPFVTHNFSFDNDPQNDYYDLSSNGEQVGERLYNQEARDKIYEILDASVFSYGDHLGTSAPKNSVIFKLSDHQITATDKLVSGVARNYKITPVYDSTSGFIDASIIGTALSKASIDNFFDNNYTTDTKFTGAINTSTPYTKEEDITFEIFKGSNFSKDDDYFEIKVKLKIETIDGGVKVSWLDDSIATFNFHAVADGVTVTIGREIPNDSGLDTWTISSGGYDFTNFLRLGVRWGQVLAKFSDSEIESFKAFFEDGGDYSWKINFGDYNFITKFGGMSSILSGKFDVADTPTNSVYPEGEYEVYEGSTSNMCFNLNVPTSSSESFTITPSYQTNKPGYVQEGEVTFSSTTVTFDAGSTQSCVTLTGVADSLSSERDEVLNFTMTNLSTGLVAGRQGSVSIILKEN